MKSLCGTVSDCSRGAAWQESQETFEESGGNEIPDSGTQVGYVTPLCELGKQTKNVLFLIGEIGQRYLPLGECHLMPGLLRCVHFFLTFFLVRSLKHSSHVQIRGQTRQGKQDWLAHSLMAHSHGWHMSLLDTRGKPRQLFAFCMAHK